MYSCDYLEAPIYEMPTVGVFGVGAYKDEPWSLQAYQKRVYAVREFYKEILYGTGVENPGYDRRVEAMLAAIARVVGKKAQHVPEPLLPKQIAALVGAADPENEKLVLIAAYCVKNSVDGDRARQEMLLDNGDITVKFGKRSGAAGGDGAAVRRL